MGQTETALAKFVLDFPTQDVPADVMHLAKRCLMNYSGVALLAKNTNPTSADVIRSMEGNMCRCGTYSRIVLAVQKAAATMKGGAR